MNNHKYNNKKIHHAEKCILAEIEKRRCLATPFTLADLAEATQLPKSIISKHTSAYVQALVDDLCTSEIKSIDELTAWRTVFNTFKGFFRTKEVYEKIRQREVRLAIEFLHAEGKLTPNNLHAQVKGAKHILAKHISEWEIETGETIKSGFTWKSRFDEHDASTGQLGFSSAEVINAEFDRRRGIGIPFKQADVVESTKRSIATISEYGKIYIAELAQELLSTVVASSSAYEKWMKDFETFQHFLRNTGRRESLLAYRLRLMIDDCERSDILATYSEIKRRSGSNHTSIRKAFEKWEIETGKQLKSGQLWQARFDEHDATTGELGLSSVDVIKADFERRRTSGIPFKQADVVESTKRSSGTVSNYGKIYTANLAQELLSTVVSSRSAYEKWMKDFETFQYFLRNTGRRESLLAYRLRLMIDDCERSDIPVSYSEIFRRSGSNHISIQKALDSWEMETGRSAVRGKAWKTITLDMVLEVVNPDLHFIPLSILDPQAKKKPFTDKHLRMIYQIRQPKLRDLAFFVLSFADTNRANDISFFSSLSRYLLELGLEDVDVLSPNTFYREFHDGILLPAESNGQRARFLQSYFRLLRSQSQYMRLLTEEQHYKFHTYSLASLTDDHFWKKSKLHAAVQAETKARRKKMTDVVHDKFYILRNLCDLRRIQIGRLYQAYQDAKKHHIETGCDLPFSFSFTDETVSSSGAVTIVRHYCRLWDGLALRKVHQPVSGNYYQNCSDNQQTISESTGTYFLSYDRSHEEDNVSKEKPYWFADLVRAHSGQSSPTETAEFLNADFGKIPGAYDWDRSAQWWLQRLAHDLQLTFIPPTLMMRCALIANSAIQIMTKTGARMNEFLQIRLTPDKLGRVALKEGRETIAFWAIPKGRTEEEPYYIDDRCMKTLHAWWNLQKNEGLKFEPVAPLPVLSHKLDIANYLWQVNGKHLDHSSINACIRVMLRGLKLKTSDGQEFDITSHLLRHSFATELRAQNTPLDVIAILMKQKDVKVTEYYSKPTPSQLVDLQKRVFSNRIDLSKSHIRPASQIARQIVDAAGKIGALVPVVGGTCTVANECPAKFACIGCAGNAPDPAKRQQVIALKSAYQKMVTLAEEQDLPAEKRKAVEVIASCDDVMIEMDLIEQADRAFASEVTLRYEGKNNG